MWGEYVEVLRCYVRAREVLSVQELVPVLTSTPGRSVSTTSTYDGWDGLPFPNKTISLFANSISTLSYVCGNTIKVFGICVTNLF